MGGRGGVQLEISEWNPYLLEIVEVKTLIHGGFGNTDNVGKYPHFLWRVFDFV